MVNGLFNLDNSQTGDYQQLDYTSLTPFTTLLYNNIFGNKNRITDINGGQAYTNGIAVDHLTKRMYHYSTGVSEDWATQLNTAENSNIGGFNDWHLVTRNELLSIIPYQNSLPWVFGPITHSVIGSKTSTTRANNATYAYISQMTTGGVNIASQLKSTFVSNILIVRIFNKIDFIIP